MQRSPFGSMPPANTEHSVLFSLSNLKQLAGAYAGSGPGSRSGVQPDPVDGLSLSLIPQTAGPCPSPPINPLYMSVQNRPRQSWMLPVAVFGCIGLALSLVAAAYYVVLKPSGPIKTVVGQDPPVVASLVGNVPSPDQAPGPSAADLERAAAAATKAQKEDKPPSPKRAIAPVMERKIEHRDKRSLKRARSRATRRSYKRRSRRSRRARGLSSNQIRRGMRRIMSRVQLCNRRYGGSGRVKVNVQLSISGKTGRVRRANVRGRMARTRTGKCIRAAVASARFSRFRGRSMNVTYPFVLR